MFSLALVKKYDIGTPYRHSIAATVEAELGPSIVVWDYLPLFYCHPSLVPNVKMDLKNIT